MVADPTTPSTWIVPSASKLSLSNPDRIIFFLLGSSLSWSKEGMVAISHDGVVEALMSMLMPGCYFCCAFSGTIGASRAAFSVSSVEF